MYLQGSCRLSRQRGFAAIEFAILMAVLMTMMTVAVDYSRLMLHYETLVKAARAAARMASSQVSTDSTLPARCLAVYGSSGVSGGACAGSTPLVPGLALGNVTIAYASQDSVSNKVTATISGLTYTGAFSTLGLSINLEDIVAVVTQPK